MFLNRMLLGEDVKFLYRRVYAAALRWQMPVQLSTKEGYFISSINPHPKSVLTTSSFRHAKVVLLRKWAWRPGLIWLQGIPTSNRTNPIVGFQGDENGRTAN